jgi:hypothetical protein
MIPAGFGSEDGTPGSKELGASTVNLGALQNALEAHSMKIKAAVLNKMGVEPPYGKSKPLSYGEVMVKIGAAGLCHSDLSGQPE